MWNSASKWYHRRIAFHISRQKGKYVVLVYFPFKLDGEWYFNYWWVIRLPF